MELQDFVKETLLQITKGVKDAQDAVKEYGAVVNPKQYKSTSDATNAKVNNEYYPVQNINFEVALTSSAGEENKTGIGVLLGNFNIGTNKNDESKSVAVTSIKFNIPLVLPAENDGNTKESYAPIIAFGKTRNNNGW
nr:hypothetical protein [uncultured Bacteroides sp.]